MLIEIDHSSSKDILKFKREKDKVEVLIEDWAMYYDEPYNPYMAPELLRKYLAGKVYGHPSHEDGKRITTGTLISFNPSAKIASSKRTTYRLGEPSEAYKKIFRRKVLRGYAESVIMIL